jgi:hypothetical protein
MLQRSTAKRTNPSASAAVHQELSALCRPALSLTTESQQHTSPAIKFVFMSLHHCSEHLVALLYLVQQVPVVLFRKHHLTTMQQLTAVNVV